MALNGINGAEDKLEMRQLVAGTIRLGEKRATSNGGQRPVDLEYFNLKDAPAVAAVYGQEPKEIDIAVWSNNVDEIAPAWLKWYGGAIKDKDGNTIGGRLKCYGNGPYEDGRPGNAIYLDKKDPLTKVAPTRPCLGTKCPDWNNANGQQQCKQMMTIYCMLPLVSVKDFYAITTSSWRSIKQILTMLAAAKELRQGHLSGAVFKLVREEQVIPYTDKNGAQKQSTHSPIMLRNNDEFLEKHQIGLKEKMIALQHSNISEFFRTNSQALLESPTGPAFALESEEVVEATAARATAESLVADPEIAALFDELGTLQGKVYSPVGRLVAARKLEKSEDFRGALVSRLQTMIAESKQKSPAATQAPVAVATEMTMAPPPPPP